MDNINKEYFNYLQKLKQSGVVNMFGASDYLAEEFDLNKNKATTILIEWMKGKSNTQS